jgi:hypothetical protein
MKPLNRSISCYETFELEWSSEAALSALQQGIQSMAGATDPKVVMGEWIV